jgi:hypothetical protein
MASPHLAGANINTFSGNMRLSGDCPENLAAHREDLKLQSQDAEADHPTLLGASPGRSSSSNHMAKDGSGAGSCTHPASTSM